MGGSQHSLGLRAGGPLAAWGSSSQGQCNLPQPNRGFVAIAGGGQYSVGLKAFSGDLNCDGRVDFADIAPFALAVTDPGAYQAAYPR